YRGASLGSGRLYELLSCSLFDRAAGTPSVIIVHDRHGRPQQLSALPAVAGKLAQIDVEFFRVFRQRIGSDRNEYGPAALAVAESFDDPAEVGIVVRRRRAAVF